MGGFFVEKIEYVLGKRLDMQFKKNQHQVWNTLFERQIPVVSQHACELFLNGLRDLNLSAKRIPSLSWLNQKITPRTGWKIIRTKIRYSDTLSWYQHFARKEFIVTDFLRSREELDFTPEPDMFHDIFGHLPFLISPEYSELFEMFTLAFFRANPEQQEAIKRLGWFSYEFGLIKENGRLKLFGTGLMSSHGESLTVMAGGTKLAPFTIENVLTKNKALTSFNEQLFFFESLDQLKTELQRFFDTLPPKPLPKITKQQLIDREMDLSMATPFATKVGNP